MAFSKGITTLNTGDLQDKVGEAAIAAHYLGLSHIPCVIQSPLRKDSKPSFGIYYKDGRVKWIDFATSERGDLYNLLGELWHTSFNETMNKIVKDFSNPSTPSIPITGTSKALGIRDIKETKKGNKLEVKIREWRDYDITYWKSYGVPLPWLQYAEIYPISHKIVTTPSGRFVLGADKYAYCFVEHKEGNITLKVYQPFNTRGYKWMSKHDRSVISLWTKIPETGDRVCICSSMKDALCLWANTNIPAIAVQGEGYSMSETAINELKRRFANVYILFDNDKAGLEDGQKLARSTGFQNLILPIFSGGKDISDYFYVYGETEFYKNIACLFGIETYKDLPF